MCSGCERPARDLGVPGKGTGLFRQPVPTTFLAHWGWVPVRGSGGFVRMEDMAASGYYQNTISRLGGTACSPKSSGPCSALLAMLWLRDPVHECN